MLHSPRWIPCESGRFCYVPLLVVPLAILAVVAISVLLLPWSIVQRYRAGTARRLARTWLAFLNAFVIGLSAAAFLTTTAISSIWIPGAFSNSILGFTGGCVLGVVGLWMTLWERGSNALYYTPNRWLVLAVTLTVAARLCYGLWRTWQMWHTAPSCESWVTASGFTGSLAAGALILGYYIIFWAGVWIFAKGHLLRRQQ